MFLNNFGNVISASSCGFNFTATTDFACLVAVNSASTSVFLNGTSFVGYISGANSQNLGLLIGATQASTTLAQNSSIICFIATYSSVLLQGTVSINGTYSTPTYYQ